MWRRLTVMGLLISGSALRADDWPQWRGPQRDGVWRESGIVERFPEGGPKVRWRAPIAAGYTGPAVAAGRVFVMDRVLAEGAKNHAEPFPQRPRNGIPGVERVLCFREADGQLLWKHEYDCPYMVSYPLGPRCTPTVDGDRVYTLGTEGNLICLEAATGKVVWAHELKKAYDVKAPLWGFSAHPLIDGDRLITLVGGDGSVAVAFDKHTGKELWRALSAMEPGYSPPIIVELNGRRQLIVWHSEAVNGLDPASGQVLWSQPLETYRGMSVSQPVLMGNRLFVTGYPKSAAMLRMTPEPPAADVLWRGDPKTTAFFSVFSTPMPDGDVIYGVNSGGMLTCIKAETGERLWQSLQAHGPKPLPSAEVFIVKCGERYFLANESGDLIIARLSPKGYEEVGRAHLLDPTSSGFNRPVLWSHPAFANRCAFMRNDKELICVSLTAEK
mgnify:CR=1 FL=1